MPPKKRKRKNPPPPPPPPTTTTTTTTTTPQEKQTVSATGELMYLISEAIVNVDVTPDTLLTRVPGTVRVLPFEDWTVCLHHPKPPFSRKVRIRRSTHGRHTHDDDDSETPLHYTWEVLEVTRKRQHKDSNKGQRTSRVRQESITSCQCSPNAQDFFESMGHTYDREFVRKGTTATVKFVNGHLEMKIFRLYTTLDDATQHINGSPLLLEIAAAVQDFTDKDGSSRSELCGATVRNTLNRLSNYVKTVVVPNGKKEYDDYRKYVR